MSGAPRLEAAHGRRLLSIATDAVAELLSSARATPRPPAPPPTADGPLAAAAAAFVTLERADRLLGCIGSLEPERPLAAVVARHAAAAARDPRLPPVTPHDFPAMSVKVAVLGPVEPLAVDSVRTLAEVLRPGVDGVVVTAPAARATFLPAVWRQLPDPAEFVDHLWRKAGVPVGAWPDHLRVARYATVEFVDPGPRAPVTTA